jgi:hypothetical protein
MGGGKLTLRYLFEKGQIFPKNNKKFLALLCEIFPCYTIAGNALFFPFSLKGIFLESG